MGMKAKIATGAVVAAVVIGVVAANADGDGDGKGDKSRQASASSGKDAGGAAKKGGDGGGADDKGTEKGSQAERFKDFVRKNGTPKEKDAVAHVTKVQGAEEQNDILDSVDVYTDFSGGMTGKGQAPSKLIASAFADWKDSKNGLVTVYDAEGEIITNGNF